MPETRKSDARIYPLEFVHPVDVLTSWLHRVLTTFCEHRFLNAKQSNAKARRAPSRRPANRKSDGAITPGSDEDAWWDEQLARGSSEVELARQAAFGIGQWLRWGLRTRAGEIETALNTELGELSCVCESFAKQRSCQGVNDAFFPSLDSLMELHRTTANVAIDPADGALEEWFAIIDAMRYKLDYALSAHRMLRTLLERPGRVRLGDSYYRYLESVGHFVGLEQNLRPQLRCAVGERDEEIYAKWKYLARLFGRVGWTFEERIRGWKLPPDAVPPDIHEILQRDGTFVLQTLTATLADRPPTAEPRLLWALGMARMPVGRPSWDSATHQLSFDGQLCKRYKKRATNQETVLNAFQEENWPPRIDDPLPPGKLHETVRELSKTNKLIRFSSDGFGQGIRWELKSPPK